MNLQSDINIDHSVELVWSTQGGDHGASDGQGSKLYTCTFCKRGFSNAQALGGHMNVHRKDRARLKLDQLSEEETLLVSVNDQKCSEETTSAAHEHEDHHHHQSGRGEEEKSSTLKRLWLFPEDDDIDCASPRKKDANLGGDHVVQLPLFVDMPSTSNPSAIRELKIEANRVSSSSSSRTKDELDLELRLGSDS